MMRRYQCPVCGYDRMLEPPKSWYICPCCGVEFENDDDEVSHEVLRAEWVARGMPWFSSAKRLPIGWNGYKQLEKAKLLSQFVVFAAPQDLRVSKQPDVAVALQDAELALTALSVAA
jgi:rubredoxin